MKIKSKFYIYAFTRHDTNEIFYVGKGCGSRYKDISKRSAYFKNIIKITTYSSHILLDNISEEEAFIKEIELIQFYKNIGQAGANFTLGGEGSSGIKRSKETREKISKAKLGKLPSNETKKKMSISRKQRTGYKHSVQTCKKNSETQKGRKRKPFSKETLEKMSIAQKARFAKNRLIKESNEN